MAHRKLSPNVEIIQSKSADSTIHAENAKSREFQGAAQQYSEKEFSSNLLSKSL